MSYPYFCRFSAALSGSASPVTQALGTDLRRGHKIDFEVSVNGLSTAHKVLQLKNLGYNFAK